MKRYRERLKIDIHFKKIEGQKQLGHETVYHESKLTRFSGLRSKAEA